VALVALFVLGPVLLLGGAGLLVWRRLTRDRERPVRRRWVVLLVAASFLPALLLSVRSGEGPLEAYAGAHADQAARLGATSDALDEAAASDAPLGPVAGVLLRDVALPYLGGVAAVWLPGSVLAALGLAWLTRPRRSPLLVREAAGLVVPERVERRLAGGLRHPPDGFALGATPDGRPVVIADAEARQHVVVCGPTGAGKTTVLRHLLDGVAARCPVVIVDCKASPALREAVEALPGSVVWELGGSVRWDALRGDRTGFASKLLAAEAYSPAAGVYRAAAQRYLQWVGAVLELGGGPRDPQKVAELLSPAALLREVRAVAKAHEAAGRAPPADLERIVRLVGDLGRTQREGLDGFAARFGVTVEGIAGVGLGAGPGPDGREALALEDAVRAGRTVLFWLNAAAYPAEVAKVGAWALLDLVRVAGLLQREGWGDARQAYFVVDEFSALDAEGRHVVPVLARAREAGVACVLATHGLADLARVDRPLPQQLVQNTAVKVLLRQGSAEDALAWARHLGQYEREERSRRLEATWLGGERDTGVATTRWRREFYVPPEELRALRTGEAVVAVAPVGRAAGRLERVRIAPPRAVGPAAGGALAA
jgi:hypothetical protein